MPADDLLQLERRVEPCAAEGGVDEVQAVPHGVRALEHQTGGRDRLLVRVLVDRADGDGLELDHVLGVVDDLWKFGKPRGCGGPWLQTRVAAGVPSDPFLMTGFDRKRVMLTADEDVEITLEIDLTGMGNWARLKTYKVKKGETLFSIARKRNTTVAEICKLNRIGKNMKLRPGQILKYN